MSCGPSEVITKLKMLFVIPAQAGIQKLEDTSVNPGPPLSRGDDTLCG
jgi:hypothetical protein